MSFNKNKLPTIATLALLLLLTPAFAHANVAHDIIYSIINKFLGLFVGLAGLLLNNSVQYSIIDFGRNYLDSGIGAAVESTWVVIRDLFNLTFIFGLVYIGFKMILNSDDSNSRRWLASLVMAALLVNFSLFITKTIVDFTNILATQIVVNGFSTASITGTGDVDISGTFMNNFGLTELFSVAEVPPGQNPWGFIFGTAIVFIVCMFVFAAGAILLFIRFAALLMYMIFSPLMFIGWVFPQLQGTTSKYWQGFLGRAFFAPIYVLLLFISAKVIFSVYGNKTVSYTDGFSGDATHINSSFVNTFPPFIIGCIFLIASIVVASKLGVDGAGAAMKAGQRFRGAVQRRTTQMATAVPRQAGRMGTNAVGENLGRRFNKLQTKDNWAGKLARTNIVDRAARKATTSAANAQFGTGTTNKAERDYKAKTNSRVQASTAYNKAQADLKDNTKSATELTAAMVALGDSIKNMTKEEKNNLSHSELVDQNVAQHLTDKDVDNLEASGKFTPQEINKIKKARSDSYTTIAETGNTMSNPNAVISAATTGPNGVVIPASGVDQRATLFKGKNAADIAKLPKEVFVNSEMVQHMTPQTVNTVINSGKLGNADINVLQTNLQNYVNTLTPGTVEHNAWSVWSQKDSVGMMFGLNLPNSTNSNQNNIGATGRRSNP